MSNLEQIIFTFQLQPVMIPVFSGFSYIISGSYELEQEFLKGILVPELQFHYGFRPDDPVPVIPNVLIYQLANAQMSIQNA